MTTTNDHPQSALEAVIQKDGTLVIPADKLGVPPGTRVHVRLTYERAPRRPFAGALDDWPDLSWEDFEAGSRLAIEDVAARSDYG